MMSMNLSDTVILKIKTFDYRCIISSFSKNETINLIQNADLTVKSGTLQNIKIYYHINFNRGKKTLNFGGY